MKPTEILKLIAQLASLATAVEPDIAAIVSLLKSHTASYEALLTEADKTEAEEISKLNAEMGQK